MRRFLATRLFTAMALLASAVNADFVQLSCVPHIVNGCSYNGLCDVGRYGEAKRTVTLNAEDDCALCENAAAQAAGISGSAFQGFCNTSSLACECGTNEATNWCLYHGANNHQCNASGGGGGQPGGCDAIGTHSGDVPRITRADVLPAFVPRRWIFALPDVAGEKTFLLVQYTAAHAAIPGLASSDDDGLYFASQIIPPYAGNLASDRLGMAEALGELITRLNHAKSTFTGARPDISVSPVRQHRGPLADGSPWSIEWRAITPMTRGFLGLEEAYPRLLYNGKAASIHDLRTSGVDPKLVE